MGADTPSSTVTKTADHEAPSSLEYVYVIFPYLRSTQPIEICGIKLYPSVNVAEIPADARGHVIALSKTFYLREDYRIKEVLYAVFPLESPDQVAEVSNRLRRVQMLLGYVYASPMRGHGDLFLDPGVTTVFMFVAKEISPCLIEGGRLTEDVSDSSESVESSPSDGLKDPIPGYEGLLNFRSYLWITQESRLYPSDPSAVLNLSQDLRMDIWEYLSHPQTWPMRRLFNDSSALVSEFDNRIFTSIEWYNRSARRSADPEESLVDLAIAFESLLGLEGTGRVTERFQESVRMLLGDLPRLDSWLEQFYKARSSIVHEGRALRLQYLSVDRKQLSSALKDSDSDREFLPLIVYGWQIFRLCLITIVTGHAVTSITNLEHDLIHSQERIDRICETLSKSDDPPARKIDAIRNQINALESNRLVSTFAITPASMVAVCSLILRTLIDIPILGPSYNVEQLSYIANTLAEHGQDRAHLLRQAEQLLPPLNDIEQLDPLAADAIDTTIRIINLALSTIPFRHTIK